MGNEGEKEGRKTKHILKTHYLKFVEESVGGGDGGNGLEGGQIVLLLYVEVLKGAADRPAGGEEREGEGGKTFLIKHVKTNR